MFSFQGLQLGGGIDGKHNVGPEIALRLQLSFSVLHREWDNLLIADPQSYNSKDDEISISPTISITINYYSKNNIALYYGGQLGLRYVRHTYKKIYLRYSTTSVENDNAYSAGILLGVEYMLSKDISVSGEQIIAFQSNVRDRDSYYQVNNSTSSLMVNIYF